MGEIITSSWIKRKPSSGNAFNVQGLTPCPGSSLSPFPFAPTNDESILFHLSAKPNSAIFLLVHFLSPLQELSSMALLSFLWNQQGSSPKYLNVSSSKLLGKLLLIPSTFQFSFIFHCQTHLSVVSTCRFFWLSISSLEHWSVFITIVWNNSHQLVIALALTKGFCGSHCIQAL